MRKLLILIIIIIAINHSKATNSWCKATNSWCIVFGDPDYKCTSRALCWWGRCKVEKDIVSQPIDNEAIVNKISLSENNRLIVEFDKRSITNVGLKTYFTEGNFMMNSDFKLPDDVTKETGISYTIKKGIYNYVENDSTITITF